MSKNLETSFLSRLHEYKEFIALSVFFTGGVFWAYELFATKKLVSELKCTLNANIRMVDGESKIKFAQDALFRIGVEKEMLDSRAHLSVEDKERKVEIQMQENGYNEILSTIRKRYEDTKIQLRENNCQSKA